MERSDYQPIMTNGYYIFEWATGVPIINDDEDEDKISNAMGQVDYYLHVDTDNEGN